MIKQKASMYDKMKTSQPSSKPKKPPIKQMTKYMQRKLAFLFMAITLALFVLGVVIARIGSNNNQEYTQIVLSNRNYSSQTLTAKRGEIKDRNGTVLATSEPVYNLILEPSIILENDASKEATLNVLCESMGYDRAELQEVLDSYPTSSYRRFRLKLSEEDKSVFEAAAEAYNNPEESLTSDQKEARGEVLGVWFEKEYQRIYPYSTLASTVLGFTSNSGKSGSYGIEQYYNDYLAGVDGRVYGYLNDSSDLERVTRAAENGGTVISTMDANIQQVVEKYIAAFEEEVGAENVGVLVTDPNTGEILAMASNHTFDLNNPSDLTNAYLAKLYPGEDLTTKSEDETVDILTNLWSNFCISTNFEPGSTSKPFTVAAALEENTESLSATYNCTGSKSFEGVDNPVKCNATHGIVTLEGALTQSCNVALMEIALHMGASTFTRYQQLFGFGMKTGIDLPGEERGILYGSDMIDIALATNGFGQNYNVNMVQMAAAMSSLINGGSYYTPRVVKQVIDADGTVVLSNTSELVRTTVSSTTSDFIKDALFTVVDSEEGTGKNVALPDYEIAGKTGTAEKLPREDNNYLVSFIGFVPYDDPQVLIYVVIDQPHVEDQQKGSFPQLMTKYILREILPYMGIAQTNTDDDIFDDGSTSFRALLDTNTESTEPAPTGETEPGESAEAETTGETDPGESTEAETTGEAEPGESTEPETTGEAEPTEEPAE